ncbi:MAG: hypothetical protein HC895_03035 [Leptolyngbyaceae cyanobacterium SM1_3_5]|nr:hypothetical protein [Leptolyngbyaceae cyanobacterium SM1_3_5]
MKTDKSQFLQIRVQIKPSSRLGLACQHLIDQDLNQNEEVKQFLEAAFYPLAMSSQGKLTREIAALCIGKLNGYIKAIESVSGIQASPEAGLTSASQVPAVAIEDEAEDELPDPPKNPPRPQIDFDHMLGLTPLPPID